MAYGTRESAIFNFSERTLPAALPHSLHGHQLLHPLCHLVLLLTPLSLVPHHAVFKGSNILLIIVILGLAYPHANTQNIANFFPYADHGVFAGVSFFFYPTTCQWHFSIINLRSMACCSRSGGCGVLCL